MILIAVYFAEMNRFYDFRLDESVPVGQIVEDMVGTIAQRERIQLSRRPGIFFLCSRKDARIFDPTISLAQNGVRSGDEIMLI